MRCCCFCPYRDCRLLLLKAAEKALRETKPVSREETPQEPQQQQQQQQRQQQQQQPTESLRAGTERGEQTETAEETEAETNEEKETEQEKETEEEQQTEAADTPENRDPADPASSAAAGAAAIAAAAGSVNDETTKERKKTQTASGVERGPMLQQQLQQTLPAADASLLPLLLQLPLPSPPSAPQIVETAWRPAETKANPKP